MAIDIISGETIPEASEQQDLLEYVDTYTDKASQKDPAEKSMAMAERAIASDMPNDMAFLYEQTKDKSSWSATIDVLKRSASRLDDEIVASALMLYAGYDGVSVTDKDWISKVTRQAKEEGDAFAQSIYKQFGDRQVAPFIPIKLTDIAALPQNLSFSILSMGTGLVTGLAIAALPIPGARKVAYLGGSIASGKAAYEMTRYHIGQTYLEALNEEEALTPETERLAKQTFAAQSHAYGLWEAIPEAISNLAFASILGKPLTKMVGKSIAGKIIQKITGLYAEEMITEAVTQWGQARIEEEAGLREPGTGQISPWQALKEVAPQTFLLTTIMGGAGATMVGVTNKAKQAFTKETKDKTPEQKAQAAEQLDDYINDVSQQQEQMKKNQEKMASDSLKSQIGWMDEQGVYHEASEPKPIEIEVPEDIKAERRAEEIGRWQYGAEPAAAIPGEPVAFLDVEGKDFDTAKAQIIYDETESNEPLGYKIQLKDGTILPNPKSDKIGGSPYFDTLEEAQQYAEGKQAPAEKPAAPKKKPTVILTAIKNITKLKERLKDPDIKKRKDVTKEADAVVKELKKSKLLNTFQRRRMVEQIEKMKGISTPEGRQKFSELLDSVVEHVETVQKRRDLKENISKRKLQKTENLRKAAKLPPMNKMNSQQLNEFTEMLKPYKEGDVFLTQRQIETVDKTDLSGIRTLREARERFAKEVGITIEEAMKIEVGILDKFRADVRLMKQNPLYKLLVESTHRAFIGSDLAFRNFERKLERLTNAARKSKKRGLTEKLVPTDQLVFEYLEAEDKAAIEERMTKEELELALFLQDEYAKALEYLIQQQTLKTGLDNYITNVRRGFFEALKGDGFVAAIKEMFDAYKLDEQTFNILDQATDQILPLEKFFQFAMKRTGNVNPTKNVAKAASIYFQTFYKKTALDSIIPKLMIYVQAITPLKTTARGLEFDTSIKKFVKEWLNTKKGRKSQRWIKQGGPLDIGIQGLKALITIWDLGVNIPVQAAATVGETAAGYVTLGKKNMAKGIYRLNTKQGKKIAEKYEGFTGKSLWRELMEPAKNIGDKAMTITFGLFAASSTRMNKLSLLGMMTKEEFESGEISDQRLAELKLDIGKMRVISGGKSIGESTTIGGVVTQYKTWAIPILNTMSSDLMNLAKNIKKGKVRSEEFTRIRRALEVTTAAILLGMAIGDREDDKSFVGQLLKKVRREAMTIMGAMDPELFASEPRMLQWIAQLGKAIKQIMILEKYKTKPGLKGVSTLARMLTPRVISMFLPKDDDKKKPRSGI